MCYSQNNEKSKLTHNAISSELFLHIGAKTEWVVMFWDTLAESALFKYLREDTIIFLTIEH